VPSYFPGALPPPGDVVPSQGDFELDGLSQNIPDSPESTVYGASEPEDRAERVFDPKVNVQLGSTP
jgi:hypothetical protein